MAEADNAPASLRRPHFDDWFLTFTDPETGRGYWIRATRLLHRSGASDLGAWFARFDPAHPMATFGIHRRTGDGEVSTDPFEVRAGECRFAGGRAGGRVIGGGHEASWDLTWPTGGPTFRLLPEAVARLSPSEVRSPAVDTRVSGTLSIDGEVAEIVAVPATQGHVWGRAHAERWAWAHCGAFDDEEAVLEAVIARGRRGPVRTPFLAFVALRWGGRWIRFSRLGARGFSLGLWRLDVESRRFRLTGRIEAPASSIIRARYRDPDGGERYCHNSEIASCRLALFERRAGGFEEVALFESRGTTHAEWAGRTPAPQVSAAVVEVAG